MVTLTTVLAWETTDREAVAGQCTVAPQPHPTSTRICLSDRATARRTSRRPTYTHVHSTRSKERGTEGQRRASCSPRCKFCIAGHCRSSAAPRIDIAAPHLLSSDRPSALTYRARYWHHLVRRASPGIFLPPARGSKEPNLPTSKAASPRCAYFEFGTIFLACVPDRKPFLKRRGMVFR